jgi:phosphorylcholine metabolism protein LicD
MKILANASVTKLRELSKAYGAPETIQVSFIKEFDKEIWLCNSFGNHIRTLKKGTKLLISFFGIEISQRALNLRVKKAVKFNEINRLEREAKDEVYQKARNIIAKNQLSKWVELLKSDRTRIDRYKSKIENSSSNASRSSNWRNWLRMKAAKHINDGKFEGLEVSVPELRESVYSL